MIKHMFWGLLLMPFLSHAMEIPVSRSQNKEKTTYYRIDFMTAEIVSYYEKTRTYISHSNPHPEGSAAGSSAAALFHILRIAYEEQQERCAKEGKTHD